jgi:hypothetical protein
MAEGRESIKNRSESIKQPSFRLPHGTPSASLGMSPRDRIEDFDSSGPNPLHFPWKPVHDKCSVKIPRVPFCADRIGF